MLRDVGPVAQALLGTLFTWALTALGAAMVFFVPKDMDPSKQQKLLDGSLGFAAGVMIAASYWSLLAPAIEAAAESGLYGSEGQWAFVPVSVGFFIGGVFVLAADSLLPEESTTEVLADLQRQVEGKEGGKGADGREGSQAPLLDAEETKRLAFERQQSWRRCILLVVAITIHNFPEGLAVGVAFGGVGKSKSQTFESAFSIAVGIGLQNFPEGLAVSLPLMRLGFSPLKSFWYGQLSGMVEPLGGLLGALLIGFAETLLPYALAFGAGAMIYVVVDDLIPEARIHGNTKTASMGCMIGFIVMMSMDVGLG